MIFQSTVIFSSLWITNLIFLGQNNNKYKLKGHSMWLCLQSSLFFRKISFWLFDKRKGYSLGNEWVATCKKGLVEWLELNNQKGKKGINHWEERKGKASGTHFLHENYIIQRIHNTRKLYLVIYFHHIGQKEKHLFVLQSFKEGYFTKESTF